MKKRVVSILLTITLVIGSASGLAGCGSMSGKSAASTQAESEASEEYVTESGEAEETVAETAEEYPDGSYTAEEPAEEAAAEEAADELFSKEAKSVERSEAGSTGSEEGSYLDDCYDYSGIEKEKEQQNNEEYSKWEEKGYTSVKKEPLSTFSADVDTASYSNLRRLIREGYALEDIPEGAVRIEEMLNYFSYDYAEPQGKEPFGVTTRIGKCPWNEEAELVMIGLKTESIDYENAPASNLVFLLDVSGSMYNDDKLPLLQESFCMLAENLSEKDRVSIVTYAGDDTIVLDGVSGDKTKKIQNALMDLEAGGGTHGSKGIMTAYELAEKHFIEGGNNRVILATDGDLNIGLTSEEELEELITEKKESGVFLSVLGFGTGNIKDNKMETLADKGNGNYAYIDSVREAKKVLVEEMTATLLTICKDVKFQVEFNPAVVSDYRLIGYENRALAKEDFADDTKDAGEIGAGHSVTVLYEVILREPLSDLSENEIEDLKYSREYKEAYQENTQEESSGIEEEWFTLSIRYKKPAGEESSLLQYPVGYECYQEKPSEDFRFAAAVAEFGLLASHSEDPADASVKNVKKTLKELDLTDEYKEEFYELVKEADRNR